MRPVVRIRPGIPRDVEGAGFFESLERNAALPERSELAPETELVPVSLRSREIGRAGGMVGPRMEHPAITILD